MMPGKSFSPACSFRTRLSRISCFTERERNPERRRSPRVCMGTTMRRFYQVASTLVMVQGFFDRRRPLVFAHRGGSALGPENTMAAFDEGLRSGADGLELDVHLSRDGRVVVHHDRTLERTTNLSGLVADRTADELARADAAYFFRRADAFPLRGQ